MYCGFNYRQDKKVSFKKVGQTIWFEQENWLILNKTEKQIQIKNIRSGKTKHIPSNSYQD